MTMGCSPAKIVLKSHRYTIEVKQTDGNGSSSVLVQSSHIVKRHCETRLEALEAGRGDGLSRLHVKLLRYELAGLQPGSIRGITSPARALHGTALHHWIASQLDCSMRLVIDTLSEAESIIARQVMG